MNKLIILLLMVAWSAGLNAQQVQHEGSFRGNIIRNVSADYLLYLPDGFEANPEAKWPLLVFLHGSGERGNDLEKVKVHGPPKLIANGEKFPFIVLSPQCPDKRDWDTETIYSLIKHIASRYRVDESRVYLTGLSMGGWATWDLAMAYPGYFAAIAPICGRIDRNYPERAAELKDMPIWVFHGAQDNIVPIQGAENMVKRLQEAGNPVKFTVYPDAGHDSWTETYNNPELYRWFMEHHR